MTMGSLWKKRRRGNVFRKYMVTALYIAQNGVIVKLICCIHVFLFYLRLFGATIYTIKNQFLIYRLRINIKSLLIVQNKQLNKLHAVYHFSYFGVWN